MTPPSIYHYKAGPGRSEKSVTTACGYNAMAESATSDKDKVTCRQCLKRMNSEIRRQGSGPDELPG